MEEVPHERNVKLFDFGPLRKQVLVHRLTGERKELQERWLLGFSGGFAFLAPEAGGLEDNSASVWVKDVLNMSVFKKPEEDLQTSKLAYHCVSDGLTTNGIDIMQDKHD